MYLKLKQPRTDQLLIESGDTYKEIENSLGLWPGAISKWRVGKRCTDSEKANRLANYLGVPFDEIWEQCSRYQNKRRGGRRAKPVPSVKCSLPTTEYKSVRKCLVSARETILFALPGAYSIDESPLTKLFNQLGAALKTMDEDIGASR